MKNMLYLITLASLKFVECIAANYESDLNTLEKYHQEQFLTDLKSQLKRFENDFRSLAIEMHDQLLTELQDVDINLQPFSKYRDLTLKMLKKITARGVTREEQVDAVVWFITEVISEEIEDFTDIPPTEMSYGSSQYVCMSQGKASGLRSLKHAGTKMSPLEDSFDLHITYVFKNLYVHYGVFYLQMLPWSSMRGSIDIMFGKNEIELVLNLPNFETLINKILRNNCIVCLKDFSVNELEYGRTRLTGKSNARSEIVSSLMDTFLKMNKTMLKRRFETQVLEEVRRSLSKSGNFVCNDKKLIELIVKKGGSVESQVLLEAFKRHCEPKF